MCTYETNENEKKKKKQQRNPYSFCMYLQQQTPSQTENNKKMFIK